MILRSLWLRPTQAHPVRALMTVLGVAIGVAAVVSTLLASRAAVASMTGDVASIAGAARLEVTRPGGIAMADIELLRPVCDEALLVPIIEGTALVPEMGELVRILGVDLLVDSQARSIELSAPDLQAARDELLFGNGAAMASSLAGQLSLQPGDDLELVVRSRKTSLEVVATFEPERFGSAWERVLLVDVAVAQELLARTGRVDRIELVPRGAAATQDELQALAARTAAQLPEGYRVAPSSARRDEGTRMVRALEFNLTALAGVSVLVGIVLVATTLATSIVQRRAQIALLRSLGASRAQLTGAVLIEAATIGLVGGVVGVLLGWVGASAAVGSVSTTVSTIAEGVIPGRINMDLRWALLGIALGLLAAMLAAILPLREALRTPPLQGLRSEHAESVTRRSFRSRLFALALLLGAAIVFVNLPPLEDRPIWAMMAVLCLLGTLLVLSGPLIDLFSGIRPSFAPTGVGVPLRLAQAALEAGRTRAAWAAAAVGVAVALAVSMTTMVGSFRQSVVDWTNQAMPSDLFLRPLAADSGGLAGRIDPEVVKIAREQIGSENVDPFYQSKAYFRNSPILLAGAAFAVVAREGGVPFLDGRPSTVAFGAALESGEVVVNEPFAQRFDVERGDLLELETPGGSIHRRVGGIYRDYSGHTGRVVLDLADFFSFYPDEGPQSVSIFVDRDVASARSALAGALAGRFEVELLDNREVRAEVLTVFERTFGVTIALQLISSVVAAIAVVAVLTALIHERRRELAVVRVLGGSRRQLFGLVLGEALLLGLAGATGGLIIGLSAGYVLVAVVNLQSFGWTLQFLMPTSLWGTLLSVIPACLLAGIFPAFLALRATPRESLHASS